MNPILQIFNPNNPEIQKGIQDRFLSIVRSRENTVTAAALAVREVVQSGFKENKVQPTQHQESTPTAKTPIESVQSPKEDEGALERVLDARLLINALHDGKQPDIPSEFTLVA